MDAWVKQDGSIEGNITETEIEELENWEYRTQTYADEGSSSAPQTVELIMQGDQSWVGRETELESAEHEETVTKTEWIASQSNTESPGNFFKFIFLIIFNLFMPRVSLVDVVFLF